MLRVDEIHGELTYALYELWHVIVIDADYVIQGLHGWLQNVLVVDLARCKQLLHDEALLCRVQEVLVSDRSSPREGPHGNRSQLDLLRDHIFEDGAQYLVHLVLTEALGCDIFADKAQGLKRSESDVDIIRECIVGEERDDIVPMAKWQLNDCNGCHTGRCSFNHCQVLVGQHGEQSLFDVAPHL